MPNDIRSFFGGKVPPKQPEQPEKQTPKRGRGRRVLDDSDEEVAKTSPKKATPKKTASKKADPVPEGEATTTSEYFGSKKSKKPKPQSGVPEVTITPKQSPAKSNAVEHTPAARTSTRKRAPANYRDDPPAKELDITMELDDGSGEPYDIDFVNPDEDNDMDQDEKPIVVRTARGTPKSAKKRKSESLDDLEDPSPKKKRAAPKKKQPVAEVPESSEMKEIFDSIPTVKAPSPPPKAEDDVDGAGKRKWVPGGGGNAGPPPAAGSKEIPEGAENCLAGLSFVFTGLLTSISRDEGIELVKKYGGRVVGAPSKKTNYVVLGSDAGPNKLQKIKDFGIKTINEDGLFELVRKLPANGGDGKAAAAHKEKKEKEEAKARELAAEAEAEEKEKASKAPSTSSTGGARANDKAPASGPDSRLWTVKYAPTQLSQICGNKGIVEKLQRWLKAFPKSQRTGFKMAGADGSGVYRAVLLHGPPGVGKTTAAHLVAKLEGYDVVETNASDTRSKKMVEAGLKGVLSTTSLMGYFAGDGAQVEASKRKLVLIMDEVDGMSAGDRGGVGALAAVCRKSQIPMILICNERRQPKMKPFDHVTYDLPFRRPTAEQIRSRIMTIAFREKMKIPGPVVDALVEGSRADIRQVVNMIATSKLDQEVLGSGGLDFDSSKEMSKAWEKHVVLKPWDIVSKILGGGMFAPTSKVTLNQKAELYFNDHEFSPLMLQENYLGTTPVSVSSLSGKERSLKHLELVEKASESISEGDLADRLIHGTEQHWSLMPVHAIFSFVRPASFVAGSQAGHQTQFTQWLGKNSSQGKLSRQVKEIQGHMRLRSSGDRHEIRQQYMPLLWHQLVERLQIDGKDAVPAIIELMDSYFLTKEDWDSILELGVGPMDMEKIKIESQAKATFTRLYNQASHPLPFMKASNVLAPKKADKAKPDLEEAIEESDEGEIADEQEEKPDAEETDLSKDKYVKAPKKAKASKAKSKKKNEPDGDDEAEAEEKPKKGKGRAKAKK